MDFLAIGASISYLIEHVPALKAWYTKYSTGQKQVIMALLILVASVVVNTLAWQGVGAWERLEWWAFYSLAKDWLVGFFGSQLNHIYVNKKLGS